MKIAIYIRVSRGDLKPENQRLRLIEYAEMKGWEYEVFEEIESTRKTRPVKEEVLKRLRMCEFDAVLIYKLDRWARSLQELIMNIDELRSRNRQFIVLTQPIDTTSSAGMLMFQILGAFAEFEREIIRERTMSGLARSVSQGKIGGRHPVDCGCGLVRPNGERHNGSIKPVRDASHKIIGWNSIPTRRKQTPSKTIPPLPLQQVPETKRPFVGVTHA